MSSIEQTTDKKQSNLVISAASTVDPRPISSAFKRTFDILVAFFGLIFLSSIFILIAILIKLDTPGPVFFRGLRMGKGEKPFNILKFRTMYETPECHNGSPITGKNDPRITPFGQWLRDTKMNELPQLWNVLIGDMSFVGPRPEAVEIVQEWSQDTRQEMFSVRPGITSPASIIYRDEEKLLQSRNVMDDYLRTILPDKLRLDRLYVRNHSFTKDLDVIFITIATLLPGFRKVKLKERWLFSGPLYRFYNRILSWFLVDVVVTTFMVGLSGLIWRISTVINLGAATYLLLAVGTALMISLINTLLGLHTVKWASASPTYVLDIGFSIGITCAFFWLLNRTILTTPWIPFSMFWLIGVMTYIGLIAVRYRERLLTGIANRWLILRGSSLTIGERVIVIGAGDLGQLAVWLLQRSTFSDVFNLVGFVDDDPHKQRTRVYGYLVLGSIEEIPALIEKYDIGLILFAISNIPPDEQKRIMDLISSTSAEMLKIPDLFDVLERSLQKPIPEENR